MTNDNHIDEFQAIAISRDLARKPEIKFIAGVLYSLATGRVVDEEIPPVYIMIAWRLLTKPNAKQLFIQALGTVA